MSISNAVFIGKRFRSPLFARYLHQFHLRNSFTGENDAVIIQSSQVMVGSTAACGKRVSALAYCCGPTVYDHSHIGHALTYLKFDLFRRFTHEYTNIDLITAMNITDVDDKIISRAIKECTHASEIASTYLSSFLDDMSSLNISRPHMMMKVSENMDTIIKFIQQLEKSGLAYINPVTGDVLADSSSLPKYYDSTNHGEEASRFVDPNKSVGKKMPSDFVLWKKAKPREPEWYYESSELPGTIAGRPGWHVECSSLINSALGPSIQFHFGGKDLLFPHHYNESVACVLFNGDKSSGSPTSNCPPSEVTRWCKHWLHFGHVIMRGEKMSKSLNNSLYIKDFLRNSSANILRIICLMFHYRSDLEFNDELLARAQEVDRKLNDLVFTLQSLMDDWRISEKNQMVNCGEQFSSFLEKVEDTIHEGLANDFNLSQGLQAIESLHSYLKHTQCGLKQELSIIDLIRCKFTLEKWMKASGLTYSLNWTFESNFNETCHGFNQREKNLINKLQEVRNELRRTGVVHMKKYKDQDVLKICDELRTWINEQGFVVADKPIK